MSRRNEIEKLISKNQPQVVKRSSDGFYYEDLYGKGRPAVEVAAEIKREAKAKKYAPKRYAVKRTAFPVITIVLCVVVLAVVGLGLVASMSRYVGVYTFAQAEEKSSVVALDPVFSALKKIGVEIEGMPTIFGEKAVVEEGILNDIAYWALPAAIVVYVVLTIVLLFVAIAGAARKKDANGTYKKVKMGFMSILNFVCALVIAASGLYLTATPATETIGFFTMSGAFAAGIGYFVLLAVPVLTFVCGCASFGKRK